MINSKPSLIIINADYSVYTALKELGGGREVLFDGSLYEIIMIVERWTLPEGEEFPPLKVEYRNGFLGPHTTLQSNIYWAFSKPCL